MNLKYSWFVSAGTEFITLVGQNIEIRQTSVGCTAYPVSICKQINTVEITA